MAFIDYQQAVDTLVMTRGHPFDREAFFGMLDSLDDVAYSAVDYPASQVFFRPELAAQYRSFLFYDMPGMDFMSVDDADGLAPDCHMPSLDVQRDFLALVERGHGLVFLHHSIAAWPAWPAYGDLVGGRFLYKPGEVRGAAAPDSGYRHEVEHTLTVEAQHPVTAGLPASFSLRDEVYLYHVFEDDVIPLLSSDYDYSDHNFYSAQEAVQGRLYSRDGWQHPPGSRLVAWARRQGRSPIVYLQCGDGPETYSDANFRRLLQNAIQWAGSDEARAWAAQED